MIKQLNKGNKAPYKGFLLGVKEYQDYLELKDMMPSILKSLESLKR